MLLMIGLLLVLSELAILDIAYSRLGVSGLR
jgi:hypothetical protein